MHSTRDRSRSWLAFLLVPLLTPGCSGAAESPADSARPASIAATAQALAPTVRALPPAAEPIATPRPAPDPTSGPAVLPAPAPSSVFHVVVQPGDTLSGIAQLYGLTLEEILAANPQIADRNVIHVGDRIAIPGRPFPEPVVAIVDGLGAATTETTFGSPWGHDISDQQQGGPLFVLERPTRITEIGAFTYGAPLKVEVCRAVREGGDLLPDRSTALATFVLPVSAAPGTSTYATVDPGLFLPAGSYFAIFAPLAGGVGSLLGGAFSPFEYRAGSLTVWLSSGARPTAQYAAVRILGRPLARPAPTEVPSESATSELSAMTVGA
jgi:LysM repeat protein